MRPVVPQNDMTMGMVSVARLAARIAGALTATMTSTRDRTSSAASLGSRSRSFSAERSSTATAGPS